jgi:uncharacterized phage-associated protein
MSFRFNEQKSIQLAAIFLEMRGGEMKHLKLIKLMYLADREALKRWGHSITGDRYVSMDKGPVLSNVLNLIHDERNPNQEVTGLVWSDCIQESDPHTVKLVRTPAVRPLSQAEMELAEEIFKLYGRENRWKLVEMTHQFPEYIKPTQNQKRFPIHHLALLRILGKTEEEAKAICAYGQSVKKTHQLLSLNG